MPFIYLNPKQSIHFPPRSINISPCQSIHYESARTHWYSLLLNDLLDELVEIELPEAFIDGSQPVAKVIIGDNEGIVLWGVVKNKSVKRNQWIRQLFKQFLRWGHFFWQSKKVGRGGGDHCECRGENGIFVTLFLLISCFCHDLWNAIMTRIEHHRHCHCCHHYQKPRLPLHNDDGISSLFKNGRQFHRSRWTHS